MKRRWCQLSTVVAALCAVSSALAQQSTATFANRDHPYQLQPGDVIEVTYTYTPEYNSTVTLQPDGEVALKFIGSLNLSGLTLAAATDRITKLAAAKLNDPEVSLTLKEYVKPHIIVEGEVNHPGSFDLHGRATALEALAWSGGFKDTAKQKQVLLIRRTDGDMAQTKLIDFKSITSAKGAREDFELQPNDILIVPKNRIGAIEPYVRLTSMGLAGLYGIAVLK
jgi:polysaccharide export outer membrane protein